MQGVKVYDSVMKAVDATGANASVVFVPARFALDAVLEAIDADLGIVWSFQSTYHRRTHWS